MKKLIKALHVIQDECNRNGCYCEQCPMSKYSAGDIICLLTETSPDNWKINDEVPKALL